jgi:hypothetical protein
VQNLLFSDGIHSFIHKHTHFLFVPHDMEAIFLVAPQTMRIVWPVASYAVRSRFLLLRLYRQTSTVDNVLNVVSLIMIVWYDSVV